MTLLIWFGICHLANAGVWWYVLGGFGWLIHLAYHSGLWR